MGRSKFEETKAMAEQGNADAQCNLGLCYWSGKDVEYDAPQAFYWFRQSAEQGYASAQYWLGCCYKNGEGVKKDKPQAFYWWRQAAEKGNVL